MTGLMQCGGCKHLDRTAPRGLVCRAFPRGIPEKLIFNRHDHRKPYPGDHGVHFEPDGAEGQEVIEMIFDRRRS